MVLLSGVFVATLRRLVSQKMLLDSHYSTTPVSLAHQRYLSVLTKRDLAVQRLSEEVFSKGNTHLKNVDALSALPEGLHSFPEVCFIGKPNVGKSTLISCLLHNPKLGRGGSIAGTTRSLQFFNVGDALLLVDTPGYGGWSRRHLPQKQCERADAFAILFRYLALRKNRNLKRVYWLIEASATTPVSIQARDEEIAAFLRREGVPFSIILTKIDRHRRYYLDQHRRSDTSTANGFTFPGHMRSIYSRIPTPLEGLRRNVREICAFLETDSVPIIGVSANRRHPKRCENLSLLQHDIVHHCTQDLGVESELMYTDLHELSYFPPSAEDIQNIKVKYPIEAFIVPQNNQLSLKRMVATHERAKMRYVGSHSRFGFLNFFDTKEEQLLDPRRDSKRKSKKGHQHGPIAEIPAPASMLVARTTSELDVSNSVSEGRRHSLVRSFSCPLLARGDDTSQAFSSCKAKSIRGINLAAAYGIQQDSANLTDQDSFALSQGVEIYSSIAVSTTQLPYLEGTTQRVVGINDVKIPRSMISTSVEELARTKEGELPWFESVSGACAYEKILKQDIIGDHASEPLFVQYDPTAQLPEVEVDSTRQVYVRSGAKNRKEWLLKKYLDKKRKARSIYMQAEGYMCPWLAGASQGKRQSVMGLNCITGSFLGKGCVLKGLKRTGFGGKSYSSKTLRNRGRATKKTGFWSA